MPAPLLPSTFTEVLRHYGSVPRIFLTKIQFVFLFIPPILQVHAISLPKAVTMCSETASGIACSGCLLTTGSAGAGNGPAAAVSLVLPVVVFADDASVTNVCLSQPVMCPTSAAAVRHR
jgi:hypothetical protein